MKARSASATSTCWPSPAEVRKILGYLPQEFGFYPNLSAETTLDHYAALKGVTVPGERKDLVHALLQQTNLWDARQQGGRRLLGRHEAAARHRDRAGGSAQAAHRR